MTALLVASIGGHLTQLHQLRSQLVDGAVLWVTNDNPHSRSLLEGEDVEWVPYVAPRDLRTAVKLLPSARRLVGRSDIDIVISTGSAIAVPYLVAAATRRRPAFYIESATRSDGPSLTGRILAAVPGVKMRTQSPLWAGPRWKYVGSVFDGFVTEPIPTSPIRRVVVSVGTMKRYQFRSLVERLVSVLPGGVEVLWQVGCTDVTGLGIGGHVALPANEMQAAMEAADVVVGHGGTGTALTALNAGKCPVLVPRRAARGEHVDDHQLQTAQRLGRAQLAVVAEVGALSFAHLEQAASRRATRLAQPPRIHLDTPSVR